MSNELEDQDELNDEDYIPLRETEGAMETLAFAAAGLVDIENAIPDEDMSATTVHVNAQKIADCLELLLVYAECYEDLSVETMIDAALLDRDIGSYTFGSTAVH